MKKAILFFGVLVMSLTSISCSTEDYDIEQVNTNDFDVQTQDTYQNNQGDGGGEQDEDGQPVNQGTKKD